VRDSSHGLADCGKQLGASVADVRDCNMRPSQPLEQLFCEGLFRRPATVERRFSDAGASSNPLEPYIGETVLAQFEAKRLEDGPISRTAARTTFARMFSWNVL